MHDDVYEHLAEALARLPEGFPRTPSRAELPMLRRLYSGEQARMASLMGRTPEPATVLAERAGLAEPKAADLLAGMVRAGLATAVCDGESGADAGYRLTPFLPGVYELQLTSLDDEFAHLFEAYMADGGALGIMGAAPAIARIAPVRGASDWILPYDDVRVILEQAGTIVLSDCICRLQRAKVGHECRFPLHVCLNLQAGDPAGREGVISKEEALALLDETEAAGLVHCVSNIAGGWDWVCNCCSCCCEFLRGLGDWHVENAVVRSYLAAVDESGCSGCGDCESRCQVGAISVAGTHAAVDSRLCLGCGLCVTGCSQAAVSLERRPGAEQAPPADWHAWEEARLEERSG